VRNSDAKQFLQFFASGSRLIYEEIQAIVLGKENSMKGSENCPAEPK
jgi:hypothetical protein